MEVPLPWERLLLERRLRGCLARRGAAISSPISGSSLIDGERSDEIALHDIGEVHRTQSRLDRVDRHVDHRGPPRADAADRRHPAPHPPRGAARGAPRAARRRSRAPLDARGRARGAGVGAAGRAASGRSRVAVARGRVVVGVRRRRSACTASSTSIAYSPDDRDLAERREARPGGRSCGSCKPTSCRGRA